MNKPGKPSPIISVIQTERGDMVIVRSVPAFPMQAAAEMYDAAGNTVLLPDGEGKMVKSINLKELIRTINEHTSLEVLALATVLRNAGIIDATYQPQCLAARPLPRGFIDPRAPKPC